MLFIVLKMYSDRDRDANIGPCTSGRYRGEDVGIRYVTKLQFC